MTFTEFEGKNDPLPRLLGGGQEVRKIGRCKIMLCFESKENDFKLNTVFQREPVLMVEDGSDALPGPSAGENSCSRILYAL
jgi:hypothetical protein